MADVVTALRAGIPDGSVIDDPDRMESYRYDKALFCPAGMPAAVVIARERGHVEHTLRTASELRVPVVPQGARSGLSGAANAQDGCIVLSLERMDRIIEIDPDNRLAVVEPGVFNADFSRAVAEHGLFYPPDPSSWEFCSIGGNLSTNSGGLCCVKYGVTTDYVRGLEVVLASGEVVRTGRRTVKGVAGYDLTRLFVGSEGTLGVITQATLALRPESQRPHTVVALYDTPVAGARATAAVMTAGLVPSLLEIMDGTTIRAVDEWKRMDLPQDAGAMVLAQSDSGGQAGASEMSRIAELLTAAGATEVIETSDSAEGELLLTARRLALLALERVSGTTMIDDVCVPLTRLADLFDGVSKVADEYGVTIGVVGHAGDGNMHPTVCFDADDEDEASRAYAAFGAVMDVGLELGGTITGEHGVGVLKKDWLAREIGDVGIRLHRDIKQALDPQGILNPGKVFG
jgi:glycolate oxidase